MTALELVDWDKGPIEAEVAMIHLSGMRVALEGFLQARTLPKSPERDMIVGTLLEQYKRYLTGLQDALREVVE